jgi:hypothetical protein
VEGISGVRHSLRDAPAVIGPPEITEVDGEVVVVTGTVEDDVVVVAVSVVEVVVVSPPDTLAKGPTVTAKNAIALEMSATVVARFRVVGSHFRIRRLFINFIP